MISCKKIPSMSFLETLIDNKVTSVYDTQGKEVVIFHLMYDKFINVYMKIKNGELFYDPQDLMR